MSPRIRLRSSCAVVCALAMAGCSGQLRSGGSTPTDPNTDPSSGPVPGSDGGCSVPAAAQAEDTSTPDHVIGDGTAASCTGTSGADAFVTAVGQGGVITFNCGPDPVIIKLTQTAKVVNTSPKVVIDGGGKVTLSGGGSVRILYQNTCDQAQVWTTSHCDDQETPQLTVQNLTFVDGNSASEGEGLGGGGGAIYALGGRLKVVNSRFFNNVCLSTGPDVGGGAIRAFEQSQGLPVYVVNSTFGGSEALGNVGSNGGALSSIGVSYTVINSYFGYNKAIGTGANSGQPGGGNGGAIYNDGNTYTLTVCGTSMEHNTANEGGGAIFFVSDDYTGSLVIQSSTLQDNPSAGFETAGYPGIFVMAKDVTVTSSTIK